MRTNQPVCGISLLTAFALILTLDVGVSQTTAFTYQGQLTESGSPATGQYDLRFGIYDVLSGGTALAAVTNAATDVSNGLFTVTLDFGGGVFTGGARWLEISAMTNGGAMFQTLNPRQPLTATPYAVRALTVSSNALADYAGAVALLNPANAFVGSFGGDGSSLSNLNATTVGGMTASNFWQLGGNAGTTAGTHFVGTTDNQPLELRVNGARAFRLEPTDGVPNVIGGGASNSVSEYSYGVTISGGDQNNVATNAFYAVIAGGHSNTIVKAQYDPVGATIGGGSANLIGGPGSTIGAGVANTVWQHYGTIGGGRNNRIDSWKFGFATYGGVIAGGQSNVLSLYSDNSAIGGGYGNVIASDAGSSTISGGGANVIGSHAGASVISGGSRNRVEGYGTSSVISGGYSNFVHLNSFRATIGGGYGNKVGAYQAGTIGGGSENTAYGSYSTVGGGAKNRLESSDAATIGGGEQNLIQSSGHYATISGGYSNAMRTAAFGTKTVSPKNSTIGGGASNVIYVATSVIGGGIRNTIGRENSLPGDGGHVIAGGSANWITSSNTHSSIGGGLSNGVEAAYATIAGGYSNNVTGNYAMIPGGEQNAATTYGFAAGRRAKANHVGAFVWADATDADIVSTNENSVTMRAAGGYRLYSDGAEASGVFLATGGGSWTSISDRNAKENFQPVDAQTVLRQVAALPLSFWNYKTQDDAVRHLGPMAQDFRAAFGLGESETGITTIDADGVALAAIQGLNQKVEGRTRQSEERMQKLEAENAILKERLEKLEALLNSRPSAAQ